MGISGLDDILGGGLTPRRMYLIEGEPGTGKTTIGLQFLLEGLDIGEPGLFVTLAESSQELRDSASSHGWALKNLNLYDLVNLEAVEPDSQYVMFHPAEVELGQITRAVMAEVERTKPVRIVFDSLSDLRLMAQDALRYRRQILALKYFFMERGCTVLLLDENTNRNPDLQLRSIVHGVISLEHLAPEYGDERRRLRVLKVRGTRFRGGYHDFKIVRGGVTVFPRLIATEHPGDFERAPVSSGLARLDHLLGGGLERGLSSLLTGPAGSGKSSIATLFAFSAAGRGEKSAIFTFDESRATYLARCAGLGMNIAEPVADGRIILQQVDPAELSPGEFSHAIRHAVEKLGVRLIVLDSLNGYMNAMSEERFMVLHLHEMLSYLGQQGVMTLLLLEQHGLLSPAVQGAVNASYLADAIIMLRYFESGGELRRAISVVKKRTGRHERTIHELQLSSMGLSIEDAMPNFAGILPGMPGLS